MTIPAICPPVRPFLRLLLAEAVEVAEAEEVDEVEVNKGCIDDVATMGSTTPSQRDVVFEKTQHESVELGELAAQ